ncbi:MAG TPA: response regulator, partial [Gammaproteobacteria bacterium]|nr:response regulator [Gammaproteobacteria bacterium]
MTHRLALVVDDSKTARVTLKRMLEKQSIDADTVDSAPAAIDYLVEKMPDVIFMDHMMPGMDG